MSTISRLIPKWPKTGLWSGLCHWQLSTTPISGHESTWGISGHIMHLEKCPQRREIIIVLSRKLSNKREMATLADLVLWTHHPPTLQAPPHITQSPTCHETLHTCTCMPELPSYQITSPTASIQTLRSRCTVETGPKVHRTHEDCMHCCTPSSQPQPLKISALVDA